MAKKHQRPRERTVNMVGVPNAETDAPRGHDETTSTTGRAATDTAGMAATLGGASGPRRRTDSEARARPMNATPTHEEGDPLSNPLPSALDTDKVEPGAGLGDPNALRATSGTRASRRMGS